LRVEKEFVLYVLQRCGIDIDIDLGGVALATIVGRVGDSVEIFTLALH
jgi:hypothetical protein